MGWKTKTAVLILVAPAMCGAPAAIAGSAPPPVFENSCKSLKTTEVSESAVQETTASTDYVPLNDGGRIDFVTKKDGCVLVTFSAVAGTSSDQALYLRIGFDGEVLCRPNDLSFANGIIEAHSMTFACGPKIVAAGNHFVQVQFRSLLGGSVQIRERTLAVSHR